MPTFSEASNQRRSSGVTFFAWLIMLSAALGLFFNIHDESLCINILNITYYIFLIILAFRVLQLKEWARRWITGVLIFNVCLDFISLLVVIFEERLLPMKTLGIFILRLGTIFYFRNPKVKEQFS